MPPASRRDLEAHDHGYRPSVGEVDVAFRIEGDVVGTDRGFEGRAFTTGAIAFAVSRDGRDRAELLVHAPNTMVLAIRDVEVQGRIDRHARRTVQLRLGRGAAISREPGAARARDGPNDPVDHRHLAYPVV